MKIFRTYLMLGLIATLLIGSRSIAAETAAPINSHTDALVQAIYAADVKAAQVSLENGADPNAISSNGQSPFMLAAGRGVRGPSIPAILQLMLDHGANVNQSDSLGRSPLMVAVQIDDPISQMTGPAGPMKVIQLLLDRGADINHKDQQGDTALSLTLYARADSYRIARLLIDRGANVNEPGSSKLTPLHYAAYINDTERVKALIKSGTDPNVKDVNGRTPLILASEAASVDTLQALLDAGADINAKDTWNATALLTTLRSQSPDAALLLVRHGADVNVADQANETPLGLAFNLSYVYPPGLSTTTPDQLNEQSKKEDALINAILDKGANVNASSGNDTPLSLAITRDRSKQGKVDAKWTRLLLEKGADVNAAPQDRDPAIFSAVISQGEAEFQGYDLTIPTLLLDHGANVNAVNAEKTTILLSALTSNDFSFAKLLVERGAKLDCVDNAHKTPLLWAAYYGQIDLINLMLAHGANINAHDDLGQGAIQLALKGGHPDAAALLHKAGAALQAIPIPAKNHLGQTIVRLPISYLPGAKGAETVTYSMGVQNGVPALLIKRGGRKIAGPVTFGSLLTDRSLWTPAELNEQRYGLSRCPEDRDAYRLFGLVNIKSRTYLGILWNEVCASMHIQYLHLVFEIAVHNGALELTLLRKSTPKDINGLFLTVDSKLPLLSKSSTGDLIMTDSEGIWKYLPSGTWKQIGPAPKNLY